MPHSPNISKEQKVEPIKLKSFIDGAVVQTGGSRSFTPSTRPPEPEEPPPPPTFSEADLKQAERDGFQKGFLEGIKSGHEQAENEQAATNKQLTALAGKFEAAVMPMFTHYSSTILKMKESTASFALAIARKVAGSALEENAEKRVAEIATRACEALTGESRVTIAVHESLGDTLENLLKPLAARLPEHTEIVILRDPAMPIADCRIDWKLGRIEYTVEEMWQRVEAAAVGIAATALRDAEQDVAALERRVQGLDQEEVIPTEAAPEEAAEETPPAEAETPGEPPQPQS
ncbi:MAG: hypothetical protein K2Q01_10075 [Rickettsiales bacterium]|nr:hypothetical protein [Rickettsiales bacterium]